MEVGEQRADDAEAVAGPNEEFRLPGTGTQRPVRRGRLECSHGRRADRDDSVTSRLGGADALHRPERELVSLGRDDGRLQLLVPQRKKAPHPDVKGEARDLDAGCAELLEKCRAQVEPRRRGCNRPRDARVHGLITLAIGQRRTLGAADVGR